MNLYNLKKAMIKHISDARSKDKEAHSFVEGYLQKEGDLHRFAA